MPLCCSSGLNPWLHSGSWYADAPTHLRPAWTPGHSSSGPGHVNPYVIPIYDPTLPGRAAMGIEQSEFPQTDKGCFFMCQNEASVLLHTCLPTFSRGNKGRQSVQSQEVSKLQQWSLNSGPERRPRFPSQNKTLECLYYSRKLTLAPF